LQAWSAEAEDAQAAEARTTRLLVKASGQASEAVSLSPSEGERCRHQPRSPLKPTFRRRKRAVHHVQQFRSKTVKRNGLNNLYKINQGSAEGPDVDFFWHIFVIL